MQKNEIRPIYQLAQKLTPNESLNLKTETARRKTRQFLIFLHKIDRYRKALPGEDSICPRTKANS